LLFSALSGHEISIDSCLLAAGAVQQAPVLSSQWDSVMLRTNGGRERESGSETQCLSIGSVRVRFGASIAKYLDLDPLRLQHPMIPITIVHRLTAIISTFAGFSFFVPQLLRGNNLWVYASDAVFLQDECPSTIIQPKVYKIFGAMSKD